MSAGLPVVAGDRMDRSLADFERACLMLIEREQERISPDIALIGVLCDAVRLSREYLTSHFGPEDTR